MIARRDLMMVMRLAYACHAIVYWHEDSHGDYQPFLQPVSDKVWRQILAGAS